MITHAETIITELQDERIGMLREWLHLNMYSYVYSYEGMKHTFTLKAQGQNEMFLLIRNFRSEIDELDFT